jgi:uncharacterized membrane protein HdeD (DUF308 family)
VLVVLGVLTVLYGLTVMSLRPAALATVALLAGFSFIAGGLVQLLVAGGLEGGWRWLGYVGGALGVVAGLAAFSWPALTLVVLAILTAWSFVLNGLVRILTTLLDTRPPLWWLGLVAGAAELALGVWAITVPGGEVLLLVTLIGIFLVISGVDAIIAGFAVRRAPHARPLHA